MPDTRTHSGLPLPSNVISASALVGSMPCDAASSSTRDLTSPSSSERLFTATKPTDGKRVSASLAKDATDSWFVSAVLFSEGFSPAVSAILAPSTSGTSIEDRPLSDRS